MSNYKVSIFENKTLYACLLLVKEIRGKIRYFNKELNVTCMRFSVGELHSRRDSAVYIF